MIGGWALDAGGITIGLTRVMFPFFAGVLLILALALLRFGETDRLWLNGTYDAACIILLFPLIVAIGGGEKAVDGRSVRIARFFGDLFCPLYITHYPLIFLCTGWVVDHAVPVERGAPAGVAVFVKAVAIACLSPRLYDVPARRWLAARTLRHHAPLRPAEARPPDRKYRATSREPCPKGAPA